MCMNAIYSISLLSIINNTVTYTLGNLKTKHIFIDTPEVFESAN